MGVDIKVKLAASFCAICMFLLASCNGSVILQATLYCQLSPSTAQYSLKLPKDTKFNAEMQQIMANLFSGSQDIADIKIRQIVVRYLLYVTDAANSNRGRLTKITHPGGLKFWSPTRYFTCDATHRSYSVAGYSRTLFSLGEDTGISSPVRVEYAEFRAAALEWLSRNNPD